MEAESNSEEGHELRWVSGIHNHFLGTEFMPNPSEVNCSIYNAFIRKICAPVITDAAQYLSYTLALLRLSPLPREEVIAAVNL